MDKPLFVASWFGATFTALIASSLFLIYASSAHITTPTVQNFALYAALPDNTGVSGEEIEIADARAKIIENFFKGYKSELANFSNKFIEVADKYSLDFRLLPAIAMQESNGGKRVIQNSYNPFGFGIYGSKVIRFDSWEEGIEVVGMALRENYINEGLKTPEQIMAKYTPPSVALGGPWARGVNTFMEELK